MASIGIDADRAVLGLPIARRVAAALLDGEVDGQAALGVERGDDEVLVEHLDVGRALDVAGGDRAGALGVDAARDRVGRLRRHDDVLEVEDDVGDVLGDTGDGVELVEGVVEAHRRDRRAGDRRQQGAAEGVAEGVAEAGLERADGEALPVGRLLADGFDGGTLHDEHDGAGPFLTWSRARR